MTRLVYALLVGLALVLAPQAVVASPPAADPSAVFRAHVDRAGIPGAALVVVEKGRVTHREAVGHCRPGEAVSPATPLLIGSLSKPLTAEAAIRLAAAGTFDLDKPLPGRGSLTPRRLMDQRSGFLRAQGMGAPAPGSAAWNNLTPRGPGGAYAYSNLNYILLGDALQRTGDRPFAELMRRIVFEPLGMTGADAAAIGPARCGSQLVFGLTVPRTEPVWAGHLAPAGFMSASADDLGRFVAAKLADDKRTSLSSSPDTYARGWRHERFGEERVYWHNGSSGSFRAAMVLLPDRDTGFVVLTNGGGWMVQDPVDDLAVALMAHFRGEPVPAPKAPIERWLRMALGAILAAILFLTGRGVWRRIRNRAQPGGVGAWVGLGVWSAALAAGLFLLPAMTGIGVFALWRLAPDIALVLFGVPLLGAIGALARVSMRRAI